MAEPFPRFQGTHFQNVDFFIEFQEAIYCTWISKAKCCGKGQQGANYRRHRLDKTYLLLATSHPKDFQWKNVIHYLKAKEY